MYHAASEVKVEYECIQQQIFRKSTDRENSQLVKQNVILYQDQYTNTKKVREVSILLCYTCTGIFVCFFYEYVKIRQL